MFLNANRRLPQVNTQLNDHETMIHNATDMSNIDTDNNLTDRMKADAKYRIQNFRFYIGILNPINKLVDFLKNPNFCITRKMHFYRLQQNVSTQIFCCVRQCVQPSTAVLYLKNMFRILVKNVT